jgi:hypothetical protein
MLEGLKKDLFFAFRQLWHKPGFAALAIVVLSLGLGANAVIFSVVNAALLRPLPFAHPEKLVALFEKDVNHAFLVSVRTILSPSLLYRLS